MCNVIREEGRGEGEKGRRGEEVKGRMDEGTKG